MAVSNPAPATVTAVPAAISAYRFLGKGMTHSQVGWMHLTGSGWERSQTSCDR
jgi:hypothetical protein